MEAADKTPEERLGTAERIRRRAAELVSLADSCVAEAGEQERSARRLRERAEVLREKAGEYRAAARAAEQAETMDDDMEAALRAPLVSFEKPASPQSGDVWMEQDPVDTSTFRRHEYHPESGWKRMGPVTS